MLLASFFCGRAMFRVGVGAVLLACSACSSAPVRTPAASATLAPRSAAEDLFERSPIRLRLRNFAAQAWRLAEPNWSRVPEHERGRVQAVFLATFAERKLVPLASAHFQAAAGADSAAAGAALEWWSRPVAGEIKFAEATASRPDPASQSQFMKRYAEVSENEAPEIRMERIRRLAAATGAVRSTLDLTHAIGHAVARVVNQVSMPAQRLDQRQLADRIRIERSDPSTVKGYESVVLAAMLQRYGEVDLKDLDAYIEFAESGQGRWYHAQASAALVAAAEEAARDIEQILAQTGETEPVFDADSLMLSLPSGGRVRMLGVAGMEYETMPAVIFRYETFLPIANLPAVRGEASEVWDRVRQDVESMGTRAVVLQATGSVAGWVFTKASSRSFAWRRDSGGDWIAVRDSPGSGGKSLESLHSETLWSVPP